MKSYFTYQVVIWLSPTLLLFIAANCSGERIRMTPLYDRIGEADVVLLGTVTKVAALETKTEQGTPEYLPVCEVRAEEVIWGGSIEKHDVVVGQPGGARDLAEKAHGGLLNRRAIWALRANKWGGADYEVLWRLFPEHEKDWEQFIEPFRKKAAELATYSRISITPVFPSTEIRPNIPLNIEVVLENKGEEAVSLGPYSRIQFETVRETRRPIRSWGAIPVIKRQDKEAVPQTSAALTLLNTTGMHGQEEQFELPPGKKISVSILARVIVEPELKDPKPVMFRLRITDRLGCVLIRTGPFTMKLSDGTLTEEDRSAEAAISKENCW